MPVDETQEHDQLNQDRCQTIPDFTEAWKRLYFESEEALARSVKEFIASQSFVSLLEQMGGCYLSAYKATSQNLDRFFANHPLPTKKDIARIAALVVSVEEKLDRFDSDLSAGMAVLTNNLIKLVESQLAFQNEMASIKENLQSIQNRLSLYESQHNAISPEAGKNPQDEITASKPNRNKKKADKEKPGGPKQP